MDLAGQKFVVIGGTSGMGRAVAQMAGSQGAAVVVVGRDADKAGTVAEGLSDAGITATALAADLTDSAAIERLAAQVNSFDHLVLSSAALSYASFLDMPLEDAQAVMDSKFWGYVGAIRALVPYMRDHGSITMFSGVAAVRPDSGTWMVTAVNAAIEGLTRALAVELAPRRVNAVSPGVVETPSWAHLSDSDREEMFAGLAKSLPAGRVGKPEDVAHAVLELASNGYTTGEVRTVDGGARLV